MCVESCYFSGCAHGYLCLFLFDLSFRSSYIVSSKTKKSLHRLFAIWKKELPKDICFQYFLMPSPDALEEPTLFKIVQNRPALHLQELFFHLKSILTDVLEALTWVLKMSDFRSRHERLWLPI